MRFVARVSPANAKCPAFGEIVEASWLGKLRELGRPRRITTSRPIACRMVTQPARCRRWHELLQQEVFCGNGSMPFPGWLLADNVDTITKRGVKIGQISRTARRKPFSSPNSREERFTSWYSGKASYAVGHWPNRQGQTNIPPLPRVSSTPLLGFRGCSPPPARRLQCGMPLSLPSTRGMTTDVKLMYWPNNSTWPRSAIVRPQQPARPRRRPRLCGRPCGSD